MKKAFLTSIVFLLAFTLSAQKVKIKGSASYKEPVNKVFLFYKFGDERIMDSSELKNGKFYFQAKVTEPVRAMIAVRFKEDERKLYGEDNAYIYLEKGTIKINIKDSFETAIIKGSKTQKEFNLLNEKLKPYNEKAKSLGAEFAEARKNKDENNESKIREKFKSLELEKEENVLKKFMAEYPDSYVSLSILTDLAGFEMNPSIVEPLFKNLSDRIQNSKLGQAFEKSIEVTKSTAIGALALDFTQNDTLGKPVSLSDFRGKYVLMDFWASWCGPCRTENPNVVKAFNKYKDKNFTVLGISLGDEDTKEAWINAIHQDNLTWTQLSDLKGWNNEVARQWDIRAVPQNFLIDPEGIIIGRNLKGEKLNDKLSELFD